MSSTNSLPGEVLKVSYLLMGNEEKVEAYLRSKGNLLQLYILDPFLKQFMEWRSLNWLLRFVMASSGPLVLAFVCEQYASN